ncbi:phosphate/phosphite/phosphonate ABC transporter substrate-binding protein, partial [candidate division CSSED10-310 bacterium]
MERQLYFSDLKTGQTTWLRRSLFCSLFVAVLFLSTAIVYPTDKEDQMEFIFFFPDSTVKNPVDATNALQTFMNIVNKEEGWSFRGYFFKKQRDLDKFLSERKVEFGVFSPMYLVENYEKLKLVPFAVPLRNGKKTYRKVIIVRKEDNLQDLQDLKGKVLAAPALGEDNIPFYNKVVFRGEIDMQTHFSEIKIVDSTNSAILAVMYQQADAAAVALTGFNIVKELNPQVNKTLTSIFTSTETPISPLCYFQARA